jgi:hypothetical protein
MRLLQVLSNNAKMSTEQWERTINGEGKGGGERGGSSLTSHSPVHVLHTGRQSTLDRAEDRGRPFGWLPMGRLGRVEKI